MRFCGLFVGFDDFTNQTTAESFDQSMRVALGVSTLERVLASTVKSGPVDFHSCPFALAIVFAIWCNATFTSLRMIEDDAESIESFRKTG